MKLQPPLLGVRLLPANDVNFRLLTTESDGEQFRKLHNTLFKNTDASVDWFRWYFDQIGNSFTRVYGAFNGRKLIGCWCVEPKKLCIDGNVADVGRCFAVGIHPDYQGQGNFIKLSQFAIQQERALGEYAYILGFPQVGKPVIGGHMKAGWERVQTISMRSWKLQVPKKKVPINNVQHVKKFNNVLPPLLSDDHAINGFVESPEYRNLRWLKHPDNHYICLMKDDAYIVLKPYGAACHILDLNGHTSANVSYLLAAGQTLAYRHGWKELTCWCADNEQCFVELMASKFELGSEFGLSVEMLAVRITADQPLKFHGLVRLNHGIEEIY